MQDVSLENILLHADEASGHYQVKVCDPGQAVIFDADHNIEELPVGFHGLVGKSFRPPELHGQQPYFATKVDLQCLGLSTFYLLTAQPLFMSADPQQKDADWLLSQQGEYTTLFQIIPFTASLVILTVNLVTPLTPDNDLGNGCVVDNFS